MKDRIHILGTPIDRLTMNETLEVIKTAIINKDQILHTVMNAGKVVMMNENEELKISTTKADLINADGQAVVWASKILGQPLPERVSGIDLMERLVEIAAKNNFKIFFLGATEEVITKLVSIYSEKFGKRIIAGYRNGYFTNEEEPEICSKINESGTDILFVGISSPKKEIFLYKNREKLSNISFLMGVGGSFDVISGKIKRAPLWMQNNGLEWLFRLLQEPKRMWKRYLIGNARFIGIVLKYLFKAR